MTTDTERWSELLDSYARHLDAQEAFLDVAARPADGDELPDATPPMAFIIPHGFPAAPTHLRSRMEELQHRTDVLAERSAAALEARSRPPSRRRVNVPERTVASMFDRSL